MKITVCEVCREREQSLPESVRKFKTHRLAQCISGTAIQPFLQGSDDVDHLASSCWYASAFITCHVLPAWQSVSGCLVLDVHVRWVRLFRAVVNTVT